MVGAAGKARIHKRREARERRLGIHARNGLDGLGRSAAGEDAQDATNALFIGREQVVAPGDSGTHGALVIGEVAGAASQDAQRLPGIEARGQLVERAMPDPCSRELDGQRESIHAPADRRHLGDRRRVVRRSARELRRDGASALEEERHPGDALQLVHGWWGGSIGQRQRRHGADLLAAHVEWRAAGDEQLQVGAGAEQIGEGRRRGQNLLEIVEDQQPGTVVGRGDQHGDEGIAR